MHVKHRQYNFRKLIDFICIIVRHFTTSKSLVTDMWFADCSNNRIILWYTINFLFDLTVACVRVVFIEKYVSNSRMGFSFSTVSTYQSSKRFQITLLLILIILMVFAFGNSIH